MRALFSRRSGARFNRGRVAAIGGGGVSELIELLELAADGFAESITNVSILRGSNPVTDPATGVQYFAYHADKPPSIINGDLALGTISPAGVVAVDNSGVSTLASDSHNFISMMIDGDGDLLLSGDMHGVAMNWARLTGGSIDFTAWATPPIEAGATDEASVTYPLFIPLANGDVLFFFRDGASGQANLVLKKWDHTAHTLTTVIAVVVNGEATESFYPHVPYWDETRGRLHCGGCWRVNTNLNTNHDQIHFWLESSDGWDTATAKQADGSAQTVPITRANAAYAAVIAQNTGLTNVGSITIGSDGHPRLWSFRDPGNGIMQLFALRYDGAAWQDQWIPDDTQLQSGVPFTYVGVTTGADHTAFSSPRALCDGTTDRTVILMVSDTEGDGVWALICERADLTQWTWRQLDATDVGFWFGAEDWHQWRANGVIDTLHQRAAYPEETDIGPIGPQTLSRLRFRPKSAAYAYTPPAALFDPDDYAGCIAYIAPRVGGVKVYGHGEAADVVKCNGLLDARDGTALFVQATNSDAPSLVWDRFGKRKGGVLFTAANADFMLCTDATFLAALGGVNTPFICTFAFETTTVVTTGMRIWSAGLDTNDYLSFGTTATNKFPVLERNVNGTVKQWVGDEALADSTEYVITAVFDGSTGYMRVNQVQQTAAADLAFVASASYTHSSLGCRRRVTNDLHASGYLGPMRFGTTIPSAGDIEAIEDALAAEYGITL